MRLKHAHTSNSGGSVVAVAVAFANQFQQLFMNDVGTKFSQSIGWVQGERTNRYAIIIDHGTVTYAEKEPGREVTVRCPRRYVPSMF